MAKKAPESQIIETQNIESLIGADAYTTLRHDSSRSYLIKLLNEQPKITLPEFSNPFKHEQYISVREQLARSTTLTAMAGDERLNALITQWIQLQQNYARQVVDNVNNEVDEQKQLLALAEKDLEKGAADRDAYNELSRKTGKELLELGEKGIRRLQELEEKVAKLDQTDKEREQLHRAITGVSRVEQTLTTLIESRAECIHYIVPSVDEAQDRLGNNIYDGPIFAPFLVSNRQTIRDIFMRNVKIPSIREGDIQRDIDLDNLPELLIELWKLYEHVTNQPIGTRITSGELKETSGIKDMSGKGIGAYLENNSTVFGVEMEKKNGLGRVFTRCESGTALDKKQFVEHILNGNIPNPIDLKQVNEFYFQKALTLLRERPEAYDGFNTETLKAIADNHGLPIKSQYFGRNLRRSDLGTKVIDSPQELKLRPPVYKFVRVVPTETQIRYVQEAVDDFGINRFSTGELAERVRKLHSDYRMHCQVAETVLKNKCDELGLRKAGDDPLIYQKKEIGTKTKAKATAERLM